MTSNSISLSWSSVNYREGIKEYKIYRDGVYKGSSKTTKFKDDSLSPSKTYRYQVSSVGNDGVESEKSKTLSVTTEKEPEPEPDPEPEP